MKLDVLSDSSPKKIVLEEYIDCLFIILYFCNIKNVDLDEKFPSIKNQDIISCFIDLSRNTCMLEKDLEKEKVKQLLIQILYLANLLGFNIIDLENGTRINEEKIMVRFKQNDYV